MRLEISNLRSLLSTSTRSEIGREALGSLGLKISNTAFAFLGTVLLARILTPTGYGIYAYVFALVTLISVPSQFGMPTLIIRETSRGAAEGDYGRIQGVWRWAGRTTAAISLALVAGAASVAWVLREPMVGERFQTLAWGLVLVPILALGRLRGAALQGLQRVVAGQVPEFLIRPALLVVLLAIAAFLFARPLTAGDAMALNVVAATAAFVAGAWMLWRATPAEVSQATPKTDGRGWWASSLPLAISGGLGILSRQASIVLLGFFVPAADIGVYRVAAQTSLLAAFGLDAVNAVVAPRFSSLFARGEMNRLQHLVTTSSRWILVFNLAVTAGFVVLGKPLLGIVFGPAYEAAYVPLVILLCGQLVNSAAGSVGVLLNMTGHERETARALGAAAISSVVLNLLLIPPLGITGAALATAISLMMWNLIMWWAVRKRLGINTLAFPVAAPRPRGAD